MTSPGPWTYDPLKTRDDNGDGVLDTLNERVGRYLELATTNVFRLGISGPGNRDGLFDLFRIPSPLAPRTFVICDVFGVKKIRIGQRTVKAGTPILYYKANTFSKVFALPARVDQRIYDAYDNDPLVKLGQMMDITKDHRLGINIENLYRPILCL